MTPITAAYYRGNKTFAVETATATPPAAGEVQLRIAYCGICGTDMHVFHGNMDARVGLNRIVGHELSAVVEALGEGVSGFSKGQKVVVRPLDPCGDCPACNAGHRHICHKLKFLGLDTDGAMQELWNVPAHTLHLLPDDMRLDHAALIEPASVIAVKASIVSDKLNPVTTTPITAACVSRIVSGNFLISFLWSWMIGSKV